MGHQKQRKGSGFFFVCLLIYLKQVTLHQQHLILLRRVKCLLPWQFGKSKNKKKVEVNHITEQPTLSLKSFLD